VRHVHYAAAAALALRPRIAGQIRAIRLATYAEALRYCANRVPRTAIAAQFSLSFGLAAALVLGDLAPEAYRSLDDPAIARIERLVELVEDTALTRAGARGATLTVTTDAGEFRETVAQVAGDPAMPMQVDAVVAKFARYAGTVLGTRLDATVRAVLHGPADALLPLPGPHPVPLPEGEGTLRQRPWPP
jgi:2-methylcitrate dehydratase PrpD